MTINHKKDKLIIFDTTLRDGEQVTTKHESTTLLRIFISFDKRPTGYSDSPNQKECEKRRRTKTRTDILVLSNIVSRSHPHSQ